MNRILVFVGVVVLCIPLVAAAQNDFLGVPLMPGGKTTLQTDTRLEQSFDLSHDDAVKFYADKLQKEKDLRFRDRSDHTFIEDHGTRPWHSITITNKGSADKKTTVIIIKDNWTWILGTLVLRFVGVFVVLLVLYVAMEISGAILARVAGKAEAKG